MANIPKINEKFLKSLQKAQESEVLICPKTLLFSLSVNRSLFCLNIYFFKKGRVREYKGEIRKRVLGNYLGNIIFFPFKLHKLLVLWHTLFQVLFN